MANLSETILRYTAQQLLGVYVQSGKLREFDVAGSLESCGLQIGTYRIIDLDELVRLSFLLNEHTRLFAKDIVTHLQTLRSATTRQFHVINGQIRGAINWAQTVPLQVTRPTSFVCLDAKRSFDLPENRMLAFLVERHNDDVKMLFQHWGGRRSNNKDSWWSQLEDLQRNLNHIRHNPHYRRIVESTDASVKNLSNRLVSRARQRRSCLAAAIFAHFGRYISVCGEKSSKEAILRVIREGLRWPDENKLFELFILFAIVNLLRTGASNPPLVTPISHRIQGADWFAQMGNLSGVKITVFYQRKPNDLSICYSNDNPSTDIQDYARILESYEDSLSELRPDIVVDCRDRNQNRRIVLLEVKNSDLHVTVRQGFRELVDYRHVTRLITGGEVTGEIRGMLCVKDLPKGRGWKINTQTANYAITTASRLLETLEKRTQNTELLNLQSFCWFAES